MSTLLDIVPAYESVSIASGETDVISIECRGISSESIAYLIRRFPDLEKLMKRADRTEVLGDPRSLIAAIPGAIAAILAAGTGHAGEEVHERAAAGLYVGAQADLLSAIMRLSMPEGIGPFMEKVTAMFGGGGLLVVPVNPGLANSLPNGKAPDTL